MSLLFTNKFLCFNLLSSFRYKTKSLAVKSRPQTNMGHICTYCNKALLSQISLEEHLRTHNGLKPFTCSQCEKSFIRSCHLERHQIIHTREKFGCLLCDKTCSWSRQLKRHQRIHTGEKLFSCSRCDTTFSCSGHLKRHLKRIHTGKKSFNCFLCNKTFLTSNNLIVHKRSHTIKINQQKEEPNDLLEYFYAESCSCKHNTDY